MKCQKCNSQMFVIGATVSERSQVTFYRCSLCVNEHVSSEPVAAVSPTQAASLFAPPAVDTQQPLPA